MIEIVVDAPAFEVLVSTGDSAEAETLDAAALAARTLARDAYEAHRAQGQRPTATFLNSDGYAVLTDRRI